MSQGLEKYKDNLRHRNVSVHAGGNSLEESEADTDTENNTDTPQEVLLTEDLQKQQEDLEVPVVSMSDFEVVDINDKLNLLMSGINKINTNFHHKFENLRKQLSDKNGVILRLQAIENAYQELLARIDDLEGEKVMVAENKSSITTLEESVSKLSDDIPTLKGFIQVQENQIWDC